MLKSVVIAGLLMGGVIEADEEQSVPMSPVANPEAVVATGNARFTVLTPALVRMEWSPDGTFEDRASQVFVNRNLPVPEFEATADGDWLVIDTGELILRHKKDGKRFGRGNLSVEFELGGRKVVWKPGTKDTGNLLGTWRTLDGVSGASGLEPGLLSRDGWAVVDDSRRLVFDRIGDRSWITPREEKKAIDWYFFGYGHDYTRALRDFTEVAGRIPLPPRYVFGAWWSRYWAYSDEELKDLVRQFREHDVPLDVLVVDMDWHLDGWTGYTWNPDYFPDPDGFVKWVEDQGLRTTFNLHPADGVGRHEAAFSEMAEAMGLDPEKAKKVPFACADPKFVDAYFRLLHHPMERQGVDFWWIDWQQGGETKIPGLDPLWWLNYLHWTDMERRADVTGRRPMIFSRWGGLGNHRYQIGFSGDTFCNWPSLAFQPFFTSTAGNVGFGYWSHDIGGHQPGPVDPELYARWIQFGIFSPVLRTHTTKNPKAERRIWAFPEDVFDSAKKAFHLRYALIPYIYTAARQCYDTAVPLCRPLYYEWPELDEAYEHGGEYLFGDDLLVAPVTEPMDPVSRCAQVKVWLPPGEWTNWFTGRTHRGPGDILLQDLLDEIPLFVRSGAIIPMMRKMHRTDEKPVDPLILHIWPGESGETRVYEDDGTSAGYEKGQCAWTPVSHKLVDGGRHITIGPVEGSFSGMLTERAYEVHLHDVFPFEGILVDGDSLPSPKKQQTPGWWYDLDTMTTVIRLPRYPVGNAIRIVATPPTVHPGGESNEQIYPFGNGLRGLLRHLRDVAGILDDPTLVAYVYPDLDDEESLSLLNANALVNLWIVWDGYQRALMQSDLDPDVKRWALIHLLGLVYRWHATATDADDGTIDLHTEIGLTVFPDGGFGDSWQASVSLQEPRNWVVAGDRSWDFKDITPQIPVTATTTLRPTGEPQTAVLEGVVSVRGEHAHVDVPIRRVLLPSINAWWIVGPFDAPFDKALATAFPPEDHIDLTATYEGKKGSKIVWRQIVRPMEPGLDLTDEFFIDFDEVFGGRKYNAVAYALTYLDAPQAMEATLALGTDDGVVIWLNGEEVHRYAEGRAYTSKEDRVPVKLRAGSNTLLLKINQGGGDWGFCVHVEDVDGGSLPEVRASLDGKLE